MFIEKFSNNGIPYLRLVESERFTNAKGIRTVRKKIIYNIGSLHKFDDGSEDYYERLKQSFKAGDPLIPELKQYCTAKPPVTKYHIEIQDEDPDCVGHPKLYSQCLIERILEELGLISFFRRYKQLTKYEFDLVGFFRLLVYGRILNPASKIATVNQNDDYYNPILTDFYPYNIYDTLTFINDHFSNIINKMNSQLISSFGRTTNIIYYDVTNFFFEIGFPDEDTEDEKGLRKNGVSKEERKLPIVQMGLFMDEQGIPISIETFPGNTLDHLTAIPALKSTVDKLDLKRFIFVGDRGMYKGDTAAHLINHNNGYVISKSIEKTSKEEKEWILNDKDYIEESPNFKYKSHIVKRKVKVNDRMQDITEKVVVYWSKKFYDKQMHENKTFLDFIEKLQQSPHSFRITKVESKNIRKFIKKDCFNEETGEILDSGKLKAILDMDKINKYKKQFGYYQIVTSELNMSDKDVIDTYHGLSRIEDQFRTMKGSLETRPLHVSTPEHIKAHLLVCMIALVVIRIIQNKIVDYKKEHDPQSETSYWSMGLSSDRVIKALNKWTVETLTNDYYRFNNLDDPDLKLILNAFNITIPRKLFGKLELKQIKTKIRVTDQNQ